MQRDTNTKLVASLAKQSLPKFEPDTFAANPALFLPWKTAFKALIQGVDASAEQEINLLLKYTAGKPKQTINTFRKRVHPDNVIKLRDLWSTLEDRFGHKAGITNALLKNLNDAAIFKFDDREGYQKFYDVCEDVNSQIPYLNGLSILNSSFYMKSLIDKVPKAIKDKWESKIAKHMVGANADDYPPFSMFVETVKSIAQKRNHPAIVKIPGTDLDPSTRQHKLGQPTNFPRGKPENTRYTKSYKTGIDSTEAPSTKPQAPRDKPKPEDICCPLHNRPTVHTLPECVLFASKDIDEREKIVKSLGICFRCLVKKHLSRYCSFDVKCDVCGKRHQTLFHREEQSANPPSDNSGEKSSLVDSGEKPVEVSTACSAVCNNGVNGKSCGKMVLGEIFDKGNPQITFRTYITLDDQSNHTLGTATLFDSLNVNSDRQLYIMETCHGRKECYGRRGLNLAVQSLDGRTFDLPTLIESNNLPQDKGEIATPEAVKQIPHLKPIADKIPPLEKSTNINLLIGRDAPELLKIRKSINGTAGAPWAQLTDLGWTVSGELCMDRVGGRIHVNSRRTMTDPIELEPCKNTIICKEPTVDVLSMIAEDEFFTTDKDSEIGLSPEDRQFLVCMQEGFHKNENSNWEAPLPFRKSNVLMPNNRHQAEKRFQSLQKNLSRNKQLQEDYFKFMGKILQRGHASRVPDDQLTTEPGKKWYLPHFGVYHPQKPTEIRVVFDSSAEYGGTSLNGELLQGPDLYNRLIGRLLRFRQSKVAFTCDIEQMFHSFFVNKNHRDFLRFLWFSEDNLESQIVEHRMNVHLFGNGPSPAVATFGLRKAAEDKHHKHSEKVQKFIREDFYVDDGVYSCDTTSEAIDLLSSAQQMLIESNLRLHKVASNDKEVMKAFPRTDLAKGLMDLDFTQDALPTKRALGVTWNLDEDVFMFQVSAKNKPYTRRGILSVINSVYDPFGFLAPYSITAKLILQNLLHLGSANGKLLNWDDPLPPDLEKEWYKWFEDLGSLAELKIPRCFVPQHFDQPAKIQLHAFSDASKDSIAAVIYLRIYDSNGKWVVSFVRGSAKVKPQKHLSIPRMELCAAVLLITLVRQTVAELEYTIDDTVYYTDSKVVLAYIQNESKRFYIYVANRVELIRSSSSPDSWRYIDSANNPADVATRGYPASKLQHTIWYSGPEFLRNGESAPCSTHDIEEDDLEVKTVKTCKVNADAKEECLICKLFSHYGSWSKLQKVIANLKLVMRQKTGKTQDNNIDLVLKKEAESFILKHVQQHAFPLEYRELARENATCPPKSNIYRLDPYMEDELIRVGGRLRKANLPLEEKHPVVLPKNNHVSHLIIYHYHGLVYHQGRSITHGSIRMAGYWIIAGASVVNSVIHKCIRCKLLRKIPDVPKMSDLPLDRLSATPPFTHVGLDAFGPWQVTTRKTRGVTTNAKRWGIIFTCLYSRAVHIEVVNSMDTSAFINAMRRFFAIRGPVSTIRSDCGTNFVGAHNELIGALNEVKEDEVKNYLLDHDCQWIFNPPHSSHFGGIWERQIGTIRRVLEGMFVEIGTAQLTDDLLSTLMLEAAAIVNSRPITAIPSDSDNPVPLSPANLLTMKSRPYNPAPGNFTRPDLYSQHRWRRSQYLADQFWLRWRKEYLQEQQRRRKWNKDIPNLKIDDIVLIHDKNSPRGVWPKGRIKKVVPSGDNVVRQVEVLVYEDDKPESPTLTGKRKVYSRPTSELILLYREGT
ncbi:hypothetical protein SNE40_022281 [Patella caerulea]